MKPLPQDEAQFAMTKDSFWTIVGMLNSSIKEDRVMGLTCIEASNWQKSAIFILLSRTQTNVDVKEWKTYAPKTVGMFSIANVPIDNKLGLREILQLYDSVMFSPDATQILEESLTKYIEKSLGNVAKDFSRKLDITVKIKDKWKKTS